MTSGSREALLKKLGSLDQMPALPATLNPLLRCMEKPLDSLEVGEVIELVSQDKSLTARCLHMANSSLFGQSRAVDTVRGAVVTLGMQRMRDIALSCSVLTLLRPGDSALDPVVFWEHSFGCALVCRQFAFKIGFVDPASAYLAGLLHDIGIIAHLWLAPREFRAAIDLARAQRIPLHEAELATLGITHTESGRVLAERWNFTPPLLQVVSFHHDPSLATSNRDLVGLVALSDLLCRMSGLAYGYIEERQVNFLEEPAFLLLLEECPSLKTFDWARFTLELEAYLEEVHRLVSLLYRGTK